MSELVLLGTSHRHGGLQSRLKLTASADVVRGFSRRVAQDPAVAETMLLSTCNRFEVYAVGRDAASIEQAIRDTIARWSGDDVLGPGQARTRLIGPDVRRHLGRVACGLESAILGETEIMGQVRRAAALARDAGTMGPVLDAVVSAALRAGRRSRMVTDISRGVQTITSAAVTLAARSLGPLGRRPALVVGAGSAARQVLLRLRSEGMDPLFVMSRSSVHAHGAASATGAAPLPIDGLPRALTAAPLVIAATHASVPLIGRASLPPHRRLPLQVLIDLSVPAAIDPAVSAEPGIRLHQLEDVEALIRVTRTSREQHVPAVEAIVAEEALV